MFDANKLATIIKEIQRRVENLERRLAAAATAFLSNIIWNETPTGDIDGNNQVFYVAYTPVSQDKMQVNYNTAILIPGEDFTVDLPTKKITFITYTPEDGDEIRVTYQKAG